MKKILLLITLMGIFLSAQCANKVFDKYRDMKGAEVMHMNLALMKSVSGITNEEIASQIGDDQEALMVGEFINSIDEIFIINTKDKALSKIKKDIKSVRNDYDEILSFREKESSYLFLYGNKGEKTEFLCFEESDKDASLIIMVGKLSLQEVGKFVSSFKAGHSSQSPHKSSSGTLPGEFSVSSTQKVQFAKGNLQYQPSTNTWRLADCQYEYVGMDNRLISPDYEGWIDLFGFGTGDNPTNASRDDSDYSAYNEWGNNAISNGGNEANSWRTLSYSEWAYIFFNRRNADGLFSLGEINGVGGIVILPDNWQNNKNTPHFLNWRDFKNLSSTEREKNEWANSYDKDSWAKMEALGAVFIPCCGYRNGKSVYAGGGAGNYFTCTPDEENKAYALGFNAGGFSIRPHNRNSDHSVRLVRDCK